MRMLRHGLLLGLLMSQAVQGYADSGANGTGAVTPTPHATNSTRGPASTGTSAPSSLCPEGPASNGTSGDCPEGKVCIERNFLIAGAVGIGLVSAVIAYISCFFMRWCKGKKKKETQEKDAESMQYASLQNLPIKEGDASRGPEQDAEKKTCYATIADIMIEPHATEEKDTDSVSLKENP